MRTRKARSGIMALIAGLSPFMVVACGGEGNSPSQPIATKPSSPVVPTGGPYVQLEGRCTAKGGVLTPAKSGGFTPGGPLNTAGVYVEVKGHRYGEPYPQEWLLRRGFGNADPDGTLSDDWKWDCAAGVGNRPDPPGSYLVTITDIRAGRTVVARVTIHER